MGEAPEILPLQRLVCAVAGTAREHALHVFALDNACAHIARTVCEPMMAQIRLAWWRDGLRAEVLTAVHEAPELAALRAMPGFAQARQGLIAMVDGWEELILGGEGETRAMLTAYAIGRGDGLFAALAPDHAERNALAGQIWALWDLAGHLSDAALAEEAILLAQQFAKDGPLKGLPRMLAMMAGPALADVRKGRGAPPVLTPGLYARMMRIQIFGR